MFNLFKNHQKWLANAIPNKKTDIPDLMRDVLYKMVKHFVEVDKGLEVNVWEEDEDHKEVLKKIEDIYFWIVEERPLMVEKLSQMWDAFPDIPESEDINKFLIEYSLTDTLQFQEKLWNKDQETLKMIIDLRDYLVIV
jgi:protein-arginine kinase